MVRFESLMLVAVTLTFQGVAQVPVATTYYVSNGGSDSANGTSEATAWRTLAKVTVFDQANGFHANDKILLQRGSFWNEGGALTLASSGSATSGRITLGDYGTATEPATISRRGYSSAAECVRLSGSYWVVKGLRLEDAQYGLRFRYDLALRSGVEVSGAYFRNIDDRTNDLDPSTGILFDGMGWQDVTVRGCVFDHVTNGVAAHAGTVTNLFIDQCEAFGGWSAGFALQNVTGGRISNSRVHDVGALSRNGTCGCFLVSCKNVVVSKCSFSRVRHGGGPDGAGIDFESGNVTCDLVDCLLFENEGPAILMFSGGGVRNTGITIRNCLFYDNNRVLHGSPDADSVLHLAIPPSAPVSTGSIIDCGFYKNALSSTYLGGNWSQFTITAPIYGDHCDGWIPVYGQFMHISVGGRGHICAIGMTIPRRAYAWMGQLTGNSWTEIAGGLLNVDSIGVGDDGEIWATDTSYTVWRFGGVPNWQAQSGVLKKVTVGSTDNIWGLDPSGGVYQRDNNTGLWVSRGMNLADIDAGPRAGDVWAIGSTPHATGTAWRYDSLWIPVSVVLSQVSAHSDDGTNNIAAGVENSSVLRTVDGTTFHSLRGQLIEVSEGSDGTLWGLDANHHVWRSH